MWPPSGGVHEIIGVDLGVSGGIARLTRSGLQVAKLNTLDPDAVGFWMRVIASVDASFATVLFERLTAPPYMERRTISSLFLSTGIVVGAVRAHRLPFLPVTAARWQRDLFGAPPRRPKTAKPRDGSLRKQLFIDKARERWPACEFGDRDGRADAAWIAEWGRRFALRRVAW